MAILELRLFDIDSYIDGNDDPKKGTFSLMTNNATSGEVNYKSDDTGSDDSSKTSAIYLMSKAGTICQYKFYISNISFRKKMYQPTEIIAVIDVYPVGNGQSAPTWSPIAKDYLCQTFQNHKASLLSLKDMDTTETAKEVIGDDYYIYEVQPHYKPDRMNITMKVYSLDKILTLTTTSQSFIAKKLCADILKTELAKYPKPYDAGSHIEYNDTHLQILRYTDKKNRTSEHIFPYLVQYNESFYDMICRTANRWGEFLYYENGKLNVGCNSSAAGTSVTNWCDLDYIDIEADQKSEKSDVYAADAVYDDHILNAEIKKDPIVIKNLLESSIKDGRDKWIVGLFSKFFSNTKNMFAFAGDLAFDEVYNHLAADDNVSYLNKKHNKKYFGSSSPQEQYGYEGSPKRFNQFSELDSKFNESKYRNVVKNELEASKRGIKLNFDTTYPNVKLGDVIKTTGDNDNSAEKFIVVEVNCTTHLTYILKDEVEIVVRDESPVLHFEVKAIGMKTEKEDGDPATVFFPTMLPSGHIRFSGPQLATVTDANDPISKTRVRVMFDSWQTIERELDKNNKPTGPIKEESKAASSPWLVYASAASNQGNGLFGSHYEGDKVIVNFAHGNVERPYIIGSFAAAGNRVPNSTNELSCILTSPGGHALRLHDGAGAGLTAFIANTFSPLYNQITTFVPSLSGADIFSKVENSKAFEGGFTLGDKYGIYSITGSTEGRNVTIKSAWGDININAFTGISINAPNGDISIKGKNVKIEAGNNLELVSGTNVDFTKLKHGDSAAQTAVLTAAEIAVEAAKKLASKAKIIDLSLIRCAVEVVYRPVEGALTVRSNRFMKLEAGKSKCSYPTSAYTDEANTKKKQADEQAIRDGIKMQAGIVEMMAKITTFADKIESDFRADYNHLVDLYKGENGFWTLVEANRKYAKGYTDNHDVEICKSLAALKDVFWAKPPFAELTEDDLGFKECFSTDAADSVDEAVYNIVCPESGELLLDDYDNEYKNTQVFTRRKNARASILTAANELRKAVCSFMERSLISSDEVGLAFGWLLKNDTPANYKSAMTKAFSKKELGDSIFAAEPTNEMKEFTNRFDQNDLANKKKALKRKAAVLMMESLGFKDEWREKQPVAQDVANQAVQVQGNDGPVQVPAPVQMAAPERPFNEADVLNADKWNAYVDSIKSVPKLSAAKYEIAKKLLDSLLDIIDMNDFKYLANIGTEKNSWESAKNGSILFTHGGNTYSLADTISKIQIAGAENLLSLDDPDDSLNQFLTAIKNDMKSL